MAGTDEMTDAEYEAWSAAMMRAARQRARRRIAASQGPRQVWPGRASVVAVTAQANMVIGQEVRRRGMGVESGGALIGRAVDRGFLDGGFRIDAATAFQDDRTERSEDRLVFNLNRLAGVEGAIGQWHTHPRSDAANLSAGDQRAAVRIAEELDLASVVMLVISRSRWGADDSTAMIARRQADGDYTIEKAALR